jgi:hypothetical protein
MINGFKKNIIQLFRKNVKGKKIELKNYNNKHCGKEGHWLEKQMKIKHTSKNTPDIFGYEMKKDSKKITFGDFLASEYLFSKSKKYINNKNKWKDNLVNITKDQFIKFFGTRKNNRYSWSGKCIPRYNNWNTCGQKLTISKKNDICIFYSYLQDKRKNIKAKFPKYLKNNNILIKTKTVGFGTTSGGIGTYRYLAVNQIPGTERTTRLESDYHIITGISTIKTFNSSIESSLKSLIRVGIGSTVALHQVYVVADQVRNNIQHYPFISIGSTSGIGTFSTQVEGLNVSIKFHPDSQFQNSKILVQSFDQFIYSDLDEFNKPDPLTYGTSKEKFSFDKYGSINNFGKDRLNFDLNYNRIPIFQKTFDPKNSDILDQATGIFTIPNHFFQNNEELIYSPGSTLSGIASSPVGIGTTIVGGNSIEGDFIVGFSTITGIGNTTGISTGNKISGKGIPNNTEIVSIGQTYSYFIGNVSSGSSIITGIANTIILSVGAGIFSGNNSSLGTIISIGINSITASAPIAAGGLDRIYYTNTLRSSLKLSNVSTGSTFR